MPEFDSYNIIIRLGIIYKHIIKYLNFLFSSKHDKLFIANLIKKFKIIVKKTFIDKKI